MNVRVADIATVYREWNQRGAKLLTEPLEPRRRAALLPGPVLPKLSPGDK
jgi:hypothetical protein